MMSYERFMFLQELLRNEFHRILIKETDNKLELSEDKFHQLTGLGFMRHVGFQFC